MKNPELRGREIPPLCGRKVSGTHLRAGGGTEGGGLGGVGIGLPGGDGGAPTAAPLCGSGKGACAALATDNSFMLSKT